jgi:VCBS repeat-containing protein
MATQTTGGGSTTSFINAPQAVDDSYCYTEDALRNSSLYNATTKAVTLDVMADDLGGSAKSLFSIDDGNGNVLEPDFELLCKDVNASGCSAWEKTSDGNWIRINSGKIEFKLGNPEYPDDPTRALDLDSLGTDRSVDDEFVYAIRLANGTLSQATVHIQITGDNDAVELGAVTDATINDSAANDAFDDIVGKLTSSDLDFGDTPTYGLVGSTQTGDSDFDFKKVTDYGTLFLNSETGDYKFVPNSAAINGLDSNDPDVALDFTVSVTDGDTTDTDTLTITINGANDTPELAAVTGATINDGAVNDSFSDVTGTLVGSDRDAGETLQYGLSGAVASTDPDYDWMKVTAYGTLYLDKDTGAYKFVANNAAIQALDDDTTGLTINFGVSVSDGDASDSDTLTITINGANDTPELAAVTDVTLSDTDADDTLGVTGTLLGSDRDAGETLQYGLASSVASTDPDYDWMKVTDFGTLYLDKDTGAYKFVGNDAAINGLDSDDADVLLNFDLSVSDGDDSAGDTLTITLEGANDAVELAAVTGAAIDDTAADDVFPDITGNLVGSDRDADEVLEYGLADSVASGLSGYDQMKVTAYGTLHLDSATGAYRFVADNAVINGLDSDDDPVAIDFAVSASDGDTSAGDTLTITVTGANDAPQAATVSLGSYHEDGLRTITPAELLAGASDVDGDPLDITDLVIASGGGTLYPNEDGTWFYRPAENASGPVTFTYTVSDGDLEVSGTANLTILPSNDPPFLDLNPDPDTNAATLDYTTGDGTVVIAPGSTVTDVDSPDFDGGYLTVHFAQGGTSGDTLAIRNQGTAAGQIGISGGNVTYGGVVIGTLTGGTAGTQLEIDFNANATQAAISTLLENITFATTDTGAASKEVHFWVNDGDGTANFGWDTFGAVAFINVEQGDVLAPTDITFALASTVGGLTGNGLGAGVTLGSFNAVDSDSSSWTFDLTPTGAIPPAIDISIVGGVVNLVTTGPVASGKYTFSVTATDGGGNVRTEAYTLSVGGSGTDTASAFTITNADLSDPNTGTDISFGLNGGDTISGGGGDDAMVGGNGTDTLNGGIGNDQLFGGQQDDIFVFNTAISPTPNVDKILDFNAANADKIHLDDAVFAGLTNGNLASNLQISATGTFTGTAMLQYNSSTGELFYDPDGAAGGASAILFAKITLVGGTLDPGDFLIV